MRWIRGLYDWVLGWANSPYSTLALFVIAFAESSFFPIPPDVLLIALAISLPSKSFRYALICTVGSVFGGMFGYLIGYKFFGTIGQAIVSFYGAERYYDRLQALYKEYDTLAVAIAGFTPIPYKVATITAGFFRLNFFRFTVASALSRAARFFLVAGLIRMFGPQIRAFIERYFEILTLVFFAALIGGFLLLRWLAG